MNVSRVIGTKINGLLKEPRSDGDEDQEGDGTVNTAEATSGGMMGFSRGFTVGIQCRVGEGGQG